MDLEIESQFLYDFNNENLFGGMQDSEFSINNDLDVYFPEAEENIKNDFYDLILSKEEWMETPSEVSSDSGFDYNSVKQELNSPPFNILENTSLIPEEIPEFELNDFMNFPDLKISPCQAEFIYTDNLDSLNSSDKQNFDYNVQLRNAILNNEDIKSDLSSPNFITSGYSDMQNKDLNTNINHLDNLHSHNLKNNIHSDLLGDNNIIDTVESILSKPVKLLVLPSDKKKMPIALKKPVKFITTISSFTSTPTIITSKSVNILNSSSNVLKFENKNTNGISSKQNSINNQYTFVSQSNNSLLTNKKGQNVQIVFPVYQSLVGSIVNNIPNKKQKLEVEKLVNSNVQILPKPVIDPSTCDMIYENHSKQSTPSPNSTDSESNSKFSPMGFSNDIYEFNQIKQTKDSPSRCMNEATKRQQKMIKNRESASLSRKRKKEYVSTLEEQLKYIENEKDRLQKENAILKQQINKLQKENNLLRIGKPVVKVSALLSICLLISFSYDGFMSITKTGNNEFVSSSNSKVNIGRKLQSLQFSTESVNIFNDLIKLNDSSRLNTTSLNELKHQFEEHNLKLVKEISDKLMCGNYFNSSESLRLMDELRGWVNGHEASFKMRENLDYAYSSSNVPVQRIKQRILPLEKSPIDQEKKRKIKIKSESSNRKKFEMQIFDGMYGTYDQFLNEIRRRNDTFYVVSFRNDHLLLPATSHNKTSRPRMSLMMPAFGLNDTLKPSFGNFAMMQIDCEVTATRLIHIKKSSIPIHLVSNSTSSDFNSKKFNGEYFDEDIPKSKIYRMPRH